MTSAADYTEKIPNNVDLREDRRLQRALESWQPNFLSWWESMGPTLPTRDVYLRTAINVGREGWAHFGHVPMRDYRWGIFLAERDRDRRIAFGEHKGEPAWQKVPGEYRADLQRLIVIQGRYRARVGGAAAQPGRHCAEPVRHAQPELLHRNSGSEDAPRILGAFNEETPDWLSFFMFTYFTDRDGKYQLGTLKESAFDPLSRTCEFMLKEESHHMFVGTTGIDRVVERTAQLMTEHDSAEVAAHGGIPLDVIQKYMNFHYSVSLDLFGGETSTNVANYFTAGLKGRWSEERRSDDHQLASEGIWVDSVTDEGEIGQTEVAALLGLNADLRREYISDCQNGVSRWNRILAEAELPQRLKLPSVAFNRKVGAFSGIEATPDGKPVSADEWQRRQGDWLPSAVDKTHVRSLMQPVHERGKIAAWIAPAYIQALLNAEEGDDVAFDGVYGPCRGLRNHASEQLLEAGHAEESGEVPGPVELIRWKIESMQRAQTDGDVENSLVLTGQVASGIHDLIHVAEFVPAIAAEAADILRKLSSSVLTAG